MRYIVIISLFIISLVAQEIKAYATNPLLTNMLYILSPQSMIGLNYEPYKEDLTYLLPEVANLPILGGFMNGKESNLEMLLSKKPNVVFASLESKNSISEFEAVLAKFNIPVIYLASGDINEMLDSLEIMGEHLGQKERASLLKKWALHNLKVLDSNISTRPSVYFALGVDGLETQCGDESKNDLAKLIGGKNIIKCTKNSKGRISINVETLLKEQPEAIFVREIALFNELAQHTYPANSSWGKLNAVREGKVYYAPSSPSNWLTRPPSLMRIIGLPWAFGKLHSNAVDLNAYNATIKEFYALFLHYPNLKDSDIDTLLQGK